MTDVPQIVLNDGRTIPQLGLGVWQVEPQDAVDVVLNALDVGYRHIDTAQMYGNEREVGEAVRKSGIRRDEVFVTSKLSNGAHAPDAVGPAFERTLEALDLGHVDLFLIHWPMPKVGDFVETWRAMDEILASGLARSIGVSNFQAAHLHRLLAETSVVPVVNQVEAHPYLTQEPLRAVHAELGIATEAWSPIARGKVAHDPVIGAIAERVGRTPVQVVLRWHLQRGDIVFPKTTSRARMEENFDVLGFALEDADMATISGLDRGERLGPDPDTFHAVPS